MNKLESKVKKKSISSKKLALIIGGAMALPFVNLGVMQYMRNEIDEYKLGVILGISAIPTLFFYLVSRGDNAPWKRDYLG